MKSGDAGRLQLAGGANRALRGKGRRGGLPGMKSSVIKVDPEIMSGAPCFSAPPDVIY